MSDSCFFDLEFQELQEIGYGDYNSGLEEGHKQGVEQGKVIGFQEGVKQNNAEILVLTGTEQSTAQDAITEINTILATNLSAKGVEADATETTEELAEKVGDIKDPQASYNEGYDVGLAVGFAPLSQSKTLDFDGFSDDDETALKSYPNIYTTRATKISFRNNYAVETVGDVYAPTATLVQFYGCSALKRVGKIYATGVVTSGASYMFLSCKELEEIPELTLGKFTEALSFVNGCTKLKKIGGTLDFSSCTRAQEAFRNCKALEEFRAVPNSINFDWANTYLATCPMLSIETIQSLADGFVDRTGQDPLILPLHADVKARLPESLIAQFTEKNITIA